MVTNDQVIKDFDKLVEDPDLEYMNEHHAFVETLGGKPAVLYRRYEEVYGRKVIEFITPDHLEKIYQNRKARIYNSKGKQVTIGKYWLEHPARKCYHTVIFDPSKAKEHDIGS